MSELKRCPFCGGEAEIDVLHHVEGNSYYVICKNIDCGATKGKFSKTKEEAIKAWNTRKPIDKVVERLEKEQEALETDMWAYESNNWYGQYCNGASEGLEKAIEIVKEEGEIS